MDVRIIPNNLKGKITIPSSKSLAHRAIISASLAEGESIIKNVYFSKDIMATIEAVKKIGAKVELGDDFVKINGSYPKLTSHTINANESGSTLRFMIPIAMLTGEEITFKGESNLINRPLDPYFKIFDEKNIRYKVKENYLPLTIYDKLIPGEFYLEGNISSQFITGLLMALPLLSSDSKINITSTLESKGYIDLTIDVLKKFGITIINNDYKEFIIKGNQKYKPCNYVLEGDYSQAAFFLVADALGADIEVVGLDLFSKQGDKKILDDLEDFGLKVEKNLDFIKVHGNPRGTKISFENTPDLAPALSTLAALSAGTSEFVDAERLRIKESDRISSMREELNKLGANVSETIDTMNFLGVNKLNGAILDSHNDHRIAMALAIASLKATGEIKIINASTVEKSYPNFWKDFESLGGKLIYE